jgi:ubiquitin-conjugating enzyme E2 Q
MELLTKHGWSPAYSIEAVIMQLGATLVKGKAEINFGGTKVSHTTQTTTGSVLTFKYSFFQDMYSLDRARASYRSLVTIHGQKGE